MKRYLLSILILIAATVRAQESLPRHSALTDLTTGILRYDYVAAAAFDPLWTGTGVIVYENNEVNFPFHPGMAGKMKIRFTVVSGGEFGPYTFYLNGKEIAVQKPTGASTGKQIIESISPSLAHRWNTLKIAVPIGRKIGVSLLEWEPAEWQELPQNGKTWEFYNPAPGRDFAWRLETEQPAELQINGKTALKVPAGNHTGIIAAALIGSGKREFKVMTKGNFRGWLNRVDDVQIGITVKSPPSPSPSELKTVELSNSRLRIAFTLPDPGVNNGARFMATGLTPSISIDQHELAGTLGNGISGLADELVEPAGYESGQNGDEFLKFGVGIFRRGSDPVYSAGADYLPALIFPWQMENSKNMLLFTQSAEWHGWSYRYKKIYRLDPDQPLLHVEHRFRNTGTENIITSHYCHNLFRLGVDRIGPEHTAEFNFAFGYRQVIGDMCAPANNRFAVIPGTGQTTFFRLSGFSGQKQNQARITAGPLSVAIRGDFIPARIYFYCTPSAISPEFHRRVELAPGQETAWSTTYEFTNMNYNHNQGKQP